MIKIIIAFLFLLSQATFANDYIDFISGTGESDSYISIVEVDKNLVMQMLPKELKLGAQRLTNQSKHPIILNFNTQFDVTMKIKDFEQRILKEYGEIIIAIPYVQIKGSQEEENFTYMHKLYLDSPIAIAMGKAYGMKKTYANIDLVNESYTVFKRNEFKIKNEINYNTNVSYFNYQVGLYKLNKILKMPLINLRRSFPLLKKQTICANFNWNLHKSDNEAINQAVYLGSEYSELLGKQEFKTKGLNANLIGGSLKLRVNWEISVPYNCQTKETAFF